MSAYMEHDVLRDETTYPIALDVHIDDLIHIMLSCDILLLIVLLLLFHTLMVIYNQGTRIACALILRILHSYSHTVD